MGVDAGGFGAFRERAITVVPEERIEPIGGHVEVDGTVEVGPNAVWAWDREAYRRLAGSPRDAGATLSFPGFWKLARRHWRAGVAEQWRSLNLSAFVREARQLIPAVERRHLGAYRAGVRAQAVDRHGVLVDDFLIEALPSVINVLNAPSPAATASLTIGNHIAASLDHAVWIHRQPNLDDWILYDCTSPLIGKVRIFADYDPKGDESTNPNLE